MWQFELLKSWFCKTMCYRFFYTHSPQDLCPLLPMTITANSFTLFPWNWCQTEAESWDSIVWHHRILYEFSNMTNWPLTLHVQVAWDDPSVLSNPKVSCNQCCQTSHYHSNITIQLHWTVNMLQHCHCRNLTIITRQAVRIYEISLHLIRDKVLLCNLSHKSTNITSLHMLYTKPAWNKLSKVSEVI